MGRPTTFLGACADGLWFGCQLAGAAVVGWMSANGVVWLTCRLIGLPFHYMAMP